MTKINRRSFLKSVALVSIAASFGIGCNGSYESVSVESSPESFFPPCRWREASGWFPLDAREGDRFWHTRRDCVYVFADGRWWKVVSANG